MKTKIAKTAFWFPFVCLVLIIPILLWGDVPSVQIPEFTLSFLRWSYYVPAQQLSPWIEVPFLMSFVAMATFWFMAEKRRFVKRNEIFYYVLSNIFIGGVVLAWYVLARKNGIQEFDAMFQATAILLVASLIILFVARTIVALFVPLISGAILSACFLFDLKHDPLISAFGGILGMVAITVAVGYIFSILFGVGFFLRGIALLLGQGIAALFGELRDAIVHFGHRIQVLWGALPAGENSAPRREIPTKPENPQNGEERKKITMPVKPVVEEPVS